VVICLEQGADLHMAQLMPLPLTVSCFSKIQTGFTFLVPAHPGSPGKGPLNVCVCVESFSYHLSCCKTCTVIPVKPWPPVPSGRSIISVLNILTASFLPNCSAHILILHLDSKIWQIPECIFSVFHHSERVQRSEQRSSLGQYEHGCRPLLLQLAKQHCQLPFPGMHHLPTEAQSHGLVSEHYRLNIKYDYYSITYTG